MNRNDSDIIAYKYEAVRNNLQRFFIVAVVAARILGSAALRVEPNENGTQCPLMRRLHSGLSQSQINYAQAQVMPLLAFFNVFFRVTLYYLSFQAQRCHVMYGRLSLEYIVFTSE